GDGKLKIVGSIDTTVRNGAFCEPSSKIAEAAKPIVEWLGEFEAWAQVEGVLPDDWSIGFPEVLEGLEIGFLRRLRTALAAAHKEGK
ncbi:hypothetical protein LCGC14_3111580, partial [marine sediment metagenome]